MSWLGDDGQRRSIEEPPAIAEPPIRYLSAELVMQTVEDEATDGEAWTPSEVGHAPIVAFVAEVCGMTPRPAQAALLSELYNDDIRTGVLRLGRRSGKDRMASWVATYEATANADRHLAHVPASELVGIAIVANSQRQARIIHRWCRDYLRRENLSHLIARDTDDELELTNGMVIVTMPCTARSTRGYAIAVVIFDEGAWYVDTDGSPLSGEELWQALVPSTAQFPDGKVLVLSTPRWSSGWFAELCRLAASGQHPDMRHWWATTRTMVPSTGPGAITNAYLESERAKDPAAFLREWEARFLSGFGAALDGESVRRAVRASGILQPRVGQAYTVAIDPAVSGDTWSLLVGHLEGWGDTAQIVVDLAKGWTGNKHQPLDTRAVLDDVATVARSYGHAPVVLDQFGQEFVAQGLIERGLSAIRQPWTNGLKAESLSSLRAYVNTARLSLPDHGALLGELLSLEQTVLPSGRPRIAAPPGQHDDYAMALLALVYQLNCGPHLAPGSRFSMIA